MTDPEVIVAEIEADPAVIIVEVPGEQGPRGASGDTARAQVFTQATPAATWTIPHAFGRLPITSVFDSDGGELLADIAASASSVTVTFAQPTAGSAVLA
ncbi:hypothetical protein [Methylobacterium sp. CM6257]